MRNKCGDNYGTGCKEDKGKMKKIKIEIFLCSKEEMQELTKEKFPNLWYRRWIRGFCQGNEVYIIENCIGRLGLLAHEMGHVVFNLKHTIAPTIMNFSGLFRWFAK